MNNAHFTTFDGHQNLGSGPWPVVALIAKRAFECQATGPVLIFSNATGESIDIDMSASDAEVVARLPAEPPVQETPPATAPAEPDESRGRGRPKLGVVPREVTLLPRHWEWLSTQPGGASVALRKLVEEARRTHAEKDKTRKMIERAYHFILGTAGDLPGFEEATRALFANDQPKFADIIANWPPDVCRHALWLAFRTDPRAAATAPSTFSML